MTKAKIYIYIYIYIYIFKQLCFWMHTLLPATHECMCMRTVACFYRKGENSCSGQGELEWKFSTLRECAVTPRWSPIAREHQITPAVMNYGDTVTCCTEEKRAIGSYYTARMAHNNSDEKSLLNLCVCCRLTTTDTYALRHFHIHNLLLLQQMPGFRSCAPRPIRNTDSSLYKATAPFIKVH